MDGAFIVPGLVSPEQFGKNCEAVASAVEELGVFTIHRNCSGSIEMAAAELKARADVCAKRKQLASDSVENFVEQIAREAVEAAQNLGVD